jgi:hypothetical protein
MAWISDCCLLAAGSEADERQNPETKSTAIIFVVHLLYVEVVTKKGEIAMESSGTTIVYLNFWSWPVHDIACNTKSPSKVEVNYFRPHY